MTFNTGNPIGSTDARDRSDNSENLDLAVNSLSPTFVDRFGVTRDTLEGIYQKSAYYRVGTFDAGYTLTNNRQTLAYGNVEYSWSGEFPKVVPAGSTPLTTGGISVGAWVDRTQETLRGDLASEYGSELISHRSQVANAVSMTLAKLQDLAPIYPEQFGAVSYGVNVAAEGMTVDSSTAMLNAFNAAVLLSRKVVLTGRYKINAGIVCHYIQYNNTSLVVEGQTAWSALVFTSTSDRVMLEIHGYRPILRGFRCENTPGITGWGTKTAIKITGREGVIDSVSFRGGWKEEIWGVDFSESFIHNTNGENDPFTRVGKTDNVGIGLRLNSCVNTVISDCFHGYNNFVYRMGYLEYGETVNSIKPSSYLETIAWGCEGITFSSLRSVQSMYGIDANGIEINHMACIIDLNKYRIATLYGVGIKFIGGWYAANTETPSASALWVSDASASQITVDDVTFDNGGGPENCLITFGNAIQTITNNKFIKVHAVVTATLFQYVAGNMAVGGAPDIVLPNIPTSQTAYFYGQNLTITKHVGQLHLGSEVPAATDGQLAVRVSDSFHRAFKFYGGDGVASAWGHAGNTGTSGTPSSINAKIYVAQDASSGRSINTSGTINSSGADYAEYMKKSATCGEIAKGQIIGINSYGLLTDKFSESISFVVKSTNPNLVGNDVVCDGLIAPELPTNPTETEIAKYNSELSIFNAEVESERLKWDRIAFCGQVPIKVAGAVAGDYVIPVSSDNDTIGYELTKTPSLEQYLLSVGKMLNAETLIVKV